MANFFLLSDPNASRRADVLESARARIAPLPGLEVGCLDHDSLAATWAIGPGSPCSLQRVADSVALLLGDARRPGGARRLSAAEFLAPGPEQPWPVVGPLDGYHAAIVHHPGRDLVVRADLLGLFPVYYWCSGDVVLAGSSPELFRLHPLFVPRVSLAGLAGILLSNGLVAGRALLEGVTRLQPGYLLLVPPGGPPREVAHYSLPLGDAYGDMSFSAQVDAVAEALTGAVQRCLPDGTSGSMLLSGGLDSRVLAGVVTELGRSPHAATFGRKPDIELTCATAVARALGLAHHVAEEPDGDRPAGAKLKARWEHLAGGFFGVGRWTGQSMLRALPPPLLSGYLLDDVMGPKGVAGVAPGASREERIALRGSRLGAWGLPPGTVDALLGTPGLSEQVLAEWRRGLSDHGQLSKAAWALQLRHRARFHVGTGLWATAFHCWPALPVLDSGLLRVVAGLPLSTLGERRAEIELVCRRFPALAALPLDRNSWDSTPLRPRLRHQVIEAVRTRLGLRRDHSSGEDRRYYRVADFNSPGWMSVRRAAEPHRAAACTILEPGTLSKALPDPDIRIAVKDGISGSSGLKLLTGFLFWAGEHLT